VNPAHLELGDQKMNGQDMIAQGSVRYGEDNPKHVIDNKTRQEIERLVKSGVKTADVARQTGINRSTVFQALERWEKQKQGVTSAKQ
jgi:hypothetical protein